MCGWCDCLVLQCSLFATLITCNLTRVFLAPPQFSEEVIGARSLVRNSIEKKLKEEAKLAK